MLVTERAEQLCMPQPGISLPAVKVEPGACFHPLGHLRFCGHDEYCDPGVFAAQLNVQPFDGSAAIAAHCDFLLLQFMEA